MYLEYVELFFKKNRAEKDYNAAIDKKQKLLYTVTPHSVVPNDIVNHLSCSAPGSNFINYSDRVTEIDENIKNTRDIFDNRTYLLKIKEAELRESKDVLDRIYVYHWLDKKKVSKFYRLVGYTREYTYDVIEKMREEMNDIRKKVQEE